MNLQRVVRSTQITFGAVALLWAQAVLGQAFSSGSTGADGAFNASGLQNVTVRAGGIYNYTTFNMPVGTTVNYLPGPDNAPLVILATGNVTIAGTLNIVGTNGAINAIGGAGGPGGFAGGTGALSPNLASSGFGPGGGISGPVNGTPGAAQRGTYGAPDAFVSLIPLFGGSGGAGGSSSFGSSGSGGGGGGGILIASSTRITVSGVIKANGGNAHCGTPNSAAGSGGAIRLVAPEIVGAGQLLAQGGAACFNSVAGGDGRIRIEATTQNFTGPAIPTPSASLTPGPVSPLGNPVLVNVPTLSITSIGGQPLPSASDINASFFTPDLTLPLGTTNPVPVAIAATNTPVGAPTSLAVRLIPQFGAWTDVPVANQTGSFASSSGSADVTFPVGRVSVVQAIASFTLTGQTASLFPLIDGEPVERVMVAAAPGAPSTMSLVTRSGRQVKFSELPQEERVKVALAWETMKDARH